MSVDRPELAAAKLRYRSIVERHYDRTIARGDLIRCPGEHANGDEHPSLHFVGPTGSKCHACGFKGTVVDFIMKEEGIDKTAACRRAIELAGTGGAGPTSQRRARPKTVQKPLLKGVGSAPKLASATVVYAYADIDGDVVVYVSRIEESGKRKAFVQQSWDGSKWVVGLQGRGPRPLYGLGQLLARPEAPVLVCEGERTADAAAVLFPTYVCVTSMGGASAARASDWSPLAGHDVTIWRDHDEPGRTYGAHVVQILQGLGATAKVVVIPDDYVSILPTGWDVADPRPDGLSVQDLADWLENAVPLPLDSAGDEHVDDHDAETTSNARADQVTSQADILASFARDCVLFTDERDADAIYADVIVDGHRETLRVESKRFREWLRARYYAACGKAARAESVKEAIETIVAEAKYGAGRVFHPVFLRSARVGDRIYLDLCNERWEAVEIERAGWRVVESPSVHFRRNVGMLPIPTPTTGGSIEALRPFLNVKSEADFVLTVAWLLHALGAVPPFPVLPLGGEQGTGKSTFAEIVRNLIDPNSVPLRSLSQKEDDLFVSAARSHVVAFDNLSNIPGWLSDALCRVADGGGLGKRTLYSDDDETLIAAARSIILTSIGEIVSRPDLADRSVFVTLERIPEEERRSKKKLMADFQRARPGILGALLTALSHGLRTGPDVRLERLPRMADFALWGSACEGALWPAGTFMKAYTANRAAAVEAVLDADQLACVLRQWLARPEIGARWEGTCTALLAILTGEADHAGNQARSKYWPSSASALSNRLRKIAPALRMVGIETNLGDRSAERRSVSFAPAVQAAETPSSSSSPSSNDRTSASDDGNDGDDDDFVSGAGRESASDTEPDDDSDDPSFSDGEEV